MVCAFLRFSVLRITLENLQDTEHSGCKKARLLLWEGDNNVK